MDEYSNINSKDKFVIFSQNLTAEKQLGRKISKSTTEDIVKCLTASVSSCKTSHNFEIRDDSVIIRGKKEPKSSDSCIDLKLSVKVLLTRENPDAIEEALRYALMELDAQQFDTVILSLPLEVLSEADDRNVSDKLNDIKPYWKAGEELVRSGITISIGISDLDTNLLSELHAWAEIKPSVNQINMISCCAIPAEMAAFAKENGIQLLTHSDARDFLPEESFRKIIDQLKPEIENVDQWKPSWIVRYHVLARYRGVVINNGYIMSVSN